MIQRVDYTAGGAARIDFDVLPVQYRARARDLFDTWAAVRGRNTELLTYYRMHNVMKDLGISIPPQLTGVNSVVGWADKAVRVMAVRSNFECFYTRSGRIDVLDAIAAHNDLPRLYDRACRSALVYGVGCMSVMAAPDGGVRIRSYSAGQFAVLWDKDLDGIGCGVVLSDVDSVGNPLRYTFHFPDKVIEVQRHDNASDWALGNVQDNPHGVPLLVPFVYDADDDRPLGHSRITPEVMGIIDKAMRDVLRMEVGSEFFTAPQRYILGADPDLFASVSDGDTDGDTDGGGVVDQTKLMRAYLGSILAITRDENDELPTVGQFPAGDAQNFIAVFENDAQRFSGATHVPLSQLGVLSNTYTSSDALSATNDPLILDVEKMNADNGRSLRQVGRLALAIANGTTVAKLPEEEYELIPHFTDPSMPTMASRADAWTKIGQLDSSIVGTRVWYEGLGLPTETIDRIMAEKGAKTAQAAYDVIFGGGQ